MSKRSIYFSVSIENIIGVEPNKSMSGRVSYLITLADMLAREQMPDLTASEWGAIVDANAGAYHDYSAGVSHVLGGLWHNLFDYASEGDEKWGVDCVSLARRMQSMPIGAQAAALEVVKKFWARAGDGNATRTYGSVLREIGAIRDRDLMP